MLFDSSLSCCFLFSYAFLFSLTLSHSLYLTRYISLAISHSLHLTHFIPLTSSHSRHLTHVISLTLSPSPFSLTPHSLDFTPSFSRTPSSLRLCFMCNRMLQQPDLGPDQVMTLLNWVPTYKCVPAFLSVWHTYCLCASMCMVILLVVCVCVCVFLIVSPGCVDRSSC